MESQVFSKVFRRLIPFMILLYIMNYLDRVNISFAKAQMAKDLNFGDAAYGFGVGAFYIGYCLFEVPSNLIMEKVGARVWMARIMVSWGAISTLMMFITGEVSFYVMRFLLGICEAGFFPGMILYLTYWLPQRKRAQAAGLFLTSTALSGVVGAPLAGLIMKMEGMSGLHGWQWLFLLEGIPTILLGVVVFFYLTDKPKDAHWLSDEERKWLCEHMDADGHASSGHGLADLRRAFTNSRVWLLCAAYCTILLGFYCIHYWAPSIITDTFGSKDPEKARGETLMIGVLTAIPYLAGVVGLIVAGRLSDRYNQHPAYTGICCMIGCVGLAAAGFMIDTVGESPVPLLIALSVAAAGIFGTLGPFWAMPSEFLIGAAAAGGIALVNSVGNLIGGFIGPYFLGKLKERTSSHSTGLLIFAGVMLTGAILSLLIRLAAAKREASRASARVSAGLEEQNAGSHGGVETLR